jgi:hypothetical protein
VSETVDPWEKAAECTAAIEATHDAKRREMLTHMRDLWINLANERHSLSAPDLADQSAQLTRIHAGLLPPTPN